MMFSINRSKTLKHLDPGTDQANNMNAKPKTVYKIDGMHCSSCAMLIEGELEDRGIQAKCSYAKGTVEVTGKPDTNIVKTAVEAAGYHLVSE